MLRRYTASADNTIVSGYQLDLKTRGTGANAGEADVMEVYSIYGRISSTSQELSRAIIKFPVSQITADRSAGKIPASGSVSFYLRMFNAQHARAVPTQYKLVVSAISQSWEEGTGLDLEDYRDRTLGNIGSNWIARTGDDVQEITKIVFSSDTASDYGAGAGANYIKLYDGSTRYNFWLDDGAGDSAPTSDGTATKVDINGLSTSGSIASAFKVVADGLSAFSANVVDPATVYVTASTAGASTDVGIEGTLAFLTASIKQSGSNETPWTNRGGTYSTASGETFTVDFKTGLEDLEVDISELVERWLGATSTLAGNYGVGVKLSASYEASASQAANDSDSNVIYNPYGATTSYYTKRFFARGTQYFFKRPVIEARWDSTTKDQRGEFYFSSSRAPAADNLNTLYFYNIIRGRLVNIPGIGSGDKILVSLYSGSTLNNGPSGSKLSLYDSNTNITGAWVSTGIYSASVGIVSSTVSPLYDVWHSGSNQYFTGSIIPKVFSNGVVKQLPIYYINLSNMKESYYRQETVRFNLYVRQKNWQPNVYTVANSSYPSLSIPSASYCVKRLIDNQTVITYGTGSDMHTGLSHDISGNYFDFDMSLLEPGYAYGFKFVFYDDTIGSWVEQDDLFRFWLNEK